MRPKDAAASDATIIAPCWTNAAIAASITALATRRRFGHKLDRIRVYYAICATQTRREDPIALAIEQLVARQLTLETSPQLRRFIILDGHTKPAFMLAQSSRVLNLLIFW